MMRGTRGLEDWRTDGPGVSGEQDQEYWPGGPEGAGGPGDVLLILS